MKDEIFLILLGALLVAPAPYAAPVVQDLGPYSVSFNLILQSGWTVQVKEPVEGRTPEGVGYVERIIRIDSDEGLAEIRVTAYGSPVPAGDGTTRALSRKVPWGIGTVGVETKERLVDRRAGSHTTFQQPRGGEVHQAAYWLDRYLAPGEYRGRTSCVISSSLPWQATKELFDTLHVEERREEAERPTTMETVIQGYYRVSFDLGDLDYTVIDGEAVAGEEEDGPGVMRRKITIDGGDKAASIMITGYSQPRLVNAETERLLAEALLQAGGYTKNNGSLWDIGGVSGVLGVGEDPNHQILYVAIFWPDQIQRAGGDLIGMTRCEVVSRYRWTETERLLSTLQVERSMEG
ncbi:hypothetical protein [Candidatus Methanocrinis natronophilus]|uniref:Uncharacterized protein n=1 Tax=Candidatus Methanocrinis natronophilus TaxID=3033396 RepID=A0ABT5X4F7_9EURY|nr:hypothetical protein [Candidatus Methanocrinis natronophilus]MDF0589582.1 hypothetical protein [Candidatus Methanocrinis natronophilus]